MTHGIRAVNTGEPSVTQSQSRPMEGPRKISDVHRTEPPRSIQNDASTAAAMPVRLTVTKKLSLRQEIRIASGLPPRFRARPEGGYNLTDNLRRLCID